MTVVKVKRKKQQPAEDDNEQVIVVDYSAPKTGPWTPADLYSRSESSRRVMFLELMVWAVNSVENIDTRREWESFKAELVETREQVWGPHPWTKATDNDAFLEHVKELADVFANADATQASGVPYPHRKTNPLADSSA